MSDIYNKYIKYKHKYLKLKKFKGGTYGNDLKINLNSTLKNTKYIIKIDKIYFMLICKFYYSERESVILKSSKVNDFVNVDNFKFISFYRSNSELGFFRFLSHGYFHQGQIIHSNHLYKGIHHYIQQTFVDLRLQKFINKHIKKIHHYDKPANINFFINQEIIDMINDPERKITIDKFIQNYNFCDDASKFDNFFIVEQMKKLSNTIDNSYTYANNKFIYKFIINNDGINLSYDIYSIELYPKPSNTTNIVLILYYAIVDFCEYDGKKFITSKIPNIGIFQNIQDTSLKNDNLHCEWSSFYIPIFLTTLDTKINEFGLYDKYVIATNYICKFLNYNEMCTKDELKNYQCSKHYSIIANRYVDLFPFNKLANTNLIENIIRDNEDFNKFDNLINIPNANTGKSPIMYAIEYNRINIVKYLIDKGANINYSNIYTGVSVLIYAIEFGNNEIIEYLIDKGADIYYKMNNKSVLMYSIVNKNKYIIHKLINMIPSYSVNYMFTIDIYDLNKMGVTNSIKYNSISNLINFFKIGYDLKSEIIYLDLNNLFDILNFLLSDNDKYTIDIIIYNICSNINKINNIVYYLKLYNNSIINWINKYKLIILILEIENSNSQINSCFSDQLKYLIFGNNFNYPIIKYPPNVEIIIFGDKFNQEINDLPNSIKEIKFGADFKQNIDNLQNSIELIILDTLYSENINKLPENLKLIKLNKKIKLSNSILKNSKIDKNFYFDNNMSSDLESDVEPSDDDEVFSNPYRFLTFTIKM